MVYSVNSRTNWDGTRKTFVQDLRCRLCVGESRLIFTQNSREDRHQSRRFEADSTAYSPYYRARYYDPSVGRFLNEDPVGLIAGINEYRFVRNSPLNWIDRFGTTESSCECDQEPNPNRMPARRRLTLVGIGLLHAGLGAAKIGLAAGAEVETAGLATPVAAYVGVQGAGDFVQGLTEVFSGAVGDNSMEALVSSAEAVTTNASISGLAVGAVTHDPALAEEAKAVEGLFLGGVLEPGNAGGVALEGLDVIHQTLGLPGILPHKCHKVRH